MKIRTVHFSVLFILLICAGKTWSQSPANCQALMQEEIAMDNVGETISKLQLFRNCGLDSMDVSFFCKPPVIAPYIMSRAADTTPITYGDIFRLIDSARKLPEYIARKEQMQHIAAIAGQVADPDHWDKETEPLLHLGFSEEDLRNAKQILLDNKYARLTYADVIYQYTAVKEAAKQNKAHSAFINELERLKEIKEQFLPCDTSGFYFTNYGMVASWSYEHALTCARMLHKPILIYFNGTYCINARKMEKGVLQDTTVRTLLEQHYILANLPCDDRSPAPADQQRYSKALERNITTVGEMNAALESEKYGSIFQPYFVLLNEKGKKIAATGYDSDVKAFLHFLQKGIK